MKHYKKAFLMQNLLKKFFAFVLIFSEEQILG